MVSGYRIGHYRSSCFGFFAEDWRTVAVVDRVCFAHNRVAPWNDPANQLGDVMSTLEKFLMGLIGLAVVAIIFRGGGSAANNILGGLAGFNERTFGTFLRA